MENNRFILLFDIMGFKKIIGSTKIDEVANKYLDIIDKIGDNTEKFIEASPYFNDSIKNIETYIFSDTILCISKANSYDDLMAIIITSINIFLESIKKGWAMSAGLSLGNVLVKKSNNKMFNSTIVVGKGIIDAYEIQNSLDVYAIVFHHTVDKYIKELPEEEKEIVSALIKWDAINIKNSQTIYGNHVNFPDLKNLKLIDFIKDLYLSTSGESRRFIDNSIELYRKSVDI